MSDLFLRIADFDIAIQTGSELPIKLEEGYQGFVVDEAKNIPAAIVNVFPSIPDTFLEVENEVYSADYNGQLLWRISKTTKGFRFHVYEPNEPYRLQQVADLSSDYRDWNIYMESKEENGKVLYPLLYPMGPLIMYYLTVINDAVLLHGSGINDTGSGRVFTGVSGKGKTTMSKIWFENGAEVINDDRLMIRRVGGEYRMYNTPMFYEDKPRSVGLNSIYLIHHSWQNEIDQLDGVEALTKLAANIIQHGYDTSLAKAHLDFLSELMKAIPVYSLGFVPNNSVVTFISENDQ